MAGSHNVQLIDQIAGLSYYMKNWLKSLQCNFQPANYSARLDYIQTGCQKNNQPTSYTVSLLLLIDITG